MDNGRCCLLSCNVRISDVYLVLWEDFSFSLNNLLKAKMTFNKKSSLLFVKVRIVEIVRCWFAPKGLITP